MKKLHSVILNNYEMGAKLKSAPVDKIYNSVRIDSHHTEVTFLGLNGREIEFCTKLFGGKQLVFKGFKRA